MVVGGGPVVAEATAGVVLFVIDSNGGFGAVIGVDLEMVRNDFS